MDTRQILRILIRRRWLLLATFVPALLLAEAVTLTQDPVYQASGTYILKLTQSSSGDAVGALDILSRRPEIATTFAEAAGSRLLVQQTAEELGISATQRASLNVASRLIAGTNILEISVQGSDPALIRDFARALGTRTIGYVQDLYGAFTLEPLDEAQLPRNPIRPNPILNLLVGGLIGIALGVALALASVLFDTEEPVMASDLVDAESGAVSYSYLSERLRQEVARSKRNGYALSVGLLNVNHHGLLDGATAEHRSEILRRVAAVSRSMLREEDLVGRAGDAIFGYVLPDMRGEDARELLDRLSAMISTSTVQVDGTSVRARLTAVAGVAESAGRDLSRDELLARARQALEVAEADPDNRVRLFAGAAGAA